tara:strand:+ start:187 stop:408 length:222 start_codon:yes stop_codon:yes gene_type:complete
MEKKIQLIDYSKQMKLESTMDVIKHYSEMIFTAEVNMGEVTNHGSVVTNKFIDSLKKRRDELAGKYFNEIYGM